MALSPSGYAVGSATSLQLVTGIKQDVDELILLLDDVALPLLRGTNFNGDPAPMLRIGAPAEQTKVEWEEEVILTPSAASTTTIASGVTTAVVGAAHQNKFQAGDRVRCPSGELISVTALVSTDSLTIVRGVAGTTAAAITTGDILQIVGTVLTEGSDPNQSRVSDISMPYNYTQIFGPWKLQMSATAQIITRWGIKDQMAHQLLNRVTEMNQQKEQALILGVRNVSSGLRTMGGISDNISTAGGNTDSSTTALTVASLNTNLGVNYLNGYTPMDLLINPQRLNTLNDPANTTILRTEIYDAGRGRKRVQFVQTEYGDIQVVRSRYVPITMAFLVGFERCARRIMRPMIVESLAKTGDADNLMLVSEETLEVRGASQFTRYTGLTTA